MHEIVQVRPTCVYGLEKYPVTVFIYCFTAKISLLRRLHLDFMRYFTDLLKM